MDNPGFVVRNNLELGKTFCCYLVAREHALNPHAALDIGHVFDM